VALTAITGWRDSAGIIHDNKREAEKAEARLQLVELIRLAIDRDGDFDLDDFLENADEIVANLEMLKD
jgi:hypothetical protein